MKIATPKALVLTGYGINCDEETKYAFEKSGARADLVHINDLIEKRRMLLDYQILAFPGGFSYGDDTGAGNALANRIRNHLFDEVKAFAESDRLTIGICNGFQVITNLGLVPAFNGNYGERNVALLHNDNARYTARWVDLRFNHKKSPWTQRIDNLMLPIAHGEGKFYADDETLNRLFEKGMVAALYKCGEICKQQDLPANPNGSLDNIAGITDESGRIFGLMPHPERAIDFTHLPHWTLLREKLRREGKEIPNDGPGIQIFKNGVGYFG